MPDNTGRKAVITFKVKVITFIVEVITFAVKVITFIVEVITFTVKVITFIVEVITTLWGTINQNESVDATARPDAVAVV